MANVVRFACLLAVLLLACGQPDPQAPAAPTRPAPPQRFTTNAANERDAAWSPDGQWICFGSLRSGNEDIWVQPADGPESAARQLTTDSGNDIYATWSPDGALIAFASDRGGRTNLWVVPAAGGQAQRVTADADSVVDVGACISSWSPDGRQLVYAAVKDGNIDVWVIPVAGGPARRLTDDPADDLWPSWSPDGEEIAFTSQRSGNQDVWVVHAEGGTARPLTSHPGSDWAPSWSPDGRWVVFSAVRTGSVELWAVPAAGGAALQLTDSVERIELVPRISRDGRRLSYNALGTPELWIVPADGSEPRQPAPGAYNGAWSPDGSEVAYMVPDSAGLAVYRQAGPDGGHVLVTRARLEAGFGALAWSPDGTTLVLTSFGSANDLWAVPASGGEAVKLTLTPGFDCCISWSAGSDRIAFDTNDRGRHRAMLVPATGWAAEPLVDWPEDTGLPQWSPDGKQLAFLAERGPRGEGTAIPQLWAKDLGSGVTRWLGGDILGALYGAPQWSPDGRELAFASTAGDGCADAAGDPGGTYIRIASSAGGVSRCLAAGSMPRWSPDGKTLAFARDDGIWTAPAAGGEPRRICAQGVGLGGLVGWSPAGTELLAVVTPVGDIWTQDITGRLGAPAASR